MFSVSIINVVYTEMFYLQNDGKGHISSFWGTEQTLSGGPNKICLLLMQNTIFTF